MYADVQAIKLLVKANENNFGKPTGYTTLEMFIKQKFEGEEIRFTENPKEADYIIEVNADTNEDISSKALESKYHVKLAALIININLKNGLSNESLYSSQISDLYGYANNLQKAGLNTYSDSKLETKLSEVLFFLKRKILVY